MSITTGVRLPAVHPYLGMDVATALAVRAERFAERTFLIWEPFEGERRAWTYAQFAAEVDQVAGGLAARGVGPGDAVMLLLDNSPAFLLTWFACARLGAVAVDTNVRYVADELRHAMQTTSPVGVVTGREHLPRLESVGGATPWVAAVDDGDAGLSQLHGDPGLIPARPADPGAPLCVQFTSGTTSRPKAALFTHANALWGAQIGAVHAGYTEDDVTLVCAPLFHTAALSWLTLSTFWAGGAVVLMPKFSASRFWDVSLRNRCTSTLALGIMLSTLSRQPVPDHHYRHWTFGLEMAAVRDLFKVNLFGAWGMTEVVTNVIVGDPRFRHEEGAIGRPSPAYQVRVTDPDGSDVAAGETGELRVLGSRGLSVFAEYLDDPTATADAFDERGWFLTGDRVTVLQSGAIKFAGRGKDMLKVGGENVAASEIERVLIQTPGVLQAAVVGRPDPILDEVPIGFITVADGINRQEIIAVAINQCTTLLADFKVPREVHVLDEIPEVLLGKVAKGKLTALARQLLAERTTEETVRASR